MAHLERLIWLAEVPFEGYPHRQPQLARRMSDRFKVLFVEPPPPGRFARNGTRIREGVHVGQVVPLLNARPALLRFGLHMPQVRSLAVRLGAWQLARLAGVEPRSAGPLVICSNVYLAAAASVLRPALMVVDICDDPRHYPGEPPWTQQLLVECVRQADLVTTSSRSLEAEFRTMGARRVEHLPNGIPEEQLHPVAARRIGGNSAAKVVGFVGHFGPWIDLELLDRVADALPDARLTLVGSVDPSVKLPFDRLSERPNVDYLGFVRHTEVPAIIAGFDVGLIPFRLSRYTRAVNPVKLYEYSAQNVPVVATAFSPDVEYFGDWIDVCTTDENFISAVANRARHGISRPTRWIAEAHTWGALAGQLTDLIHHTAPAAH